MFLKDMVCYPDAHQAKHGCQVPQQNRSLFMKQPSEETEEQISDPPS